VNALQALPFTVTEHGKLKSEISFRVCEILSNFFGGRLGDGHWTEIPANIEAIEIFFAHRLSRCFSRFNPFLTGKP
jgi:hypothetical protein